ncbi:agip128 [Agrotis ipsilon multiple nucleopolyhedrovirus]|uniref:Inhibitor of apoptosis-3 n=1 Tax=Agrotis ipsilon multiple nucleopolyhedrovirus TaxID=208013 RepID=B6D642_9ABAC|nr:agip128 [Agrotis ipsilon multiple nucleopolyhedrovirus]ACI28829.1 inhibitor of apoptosis-3 [Agrotis ipsilon multiple nucleopolyhedrovirus]
MQSFEERLMSFAEWPASNHVSPQQLASAGFYYMGVGDEVRCAFCKVEIMRWQPGDDPLTDHKRWAPQCKFLREIIEDDIGVGDGGGGDSDECGSRASDTIVGRPKHPAFNSYNARIQTYKNLWPKGLSQTPHLMASAGFFYTGLGDMVVCFHDDCRLKEWKAGDDPWREHARWFANCPFVRKVKGFEFIQQTMTAACTVKSNDNNDNNDDNESSSAAEHDDKLLCKICFENTRNVCFMPCGHVVCCRNCSMSVDRCPLCRDEFKSIQKLFYA